MGGSINTNNADLQTNQNMSYYAAGKKIRIYTVSFGSGITSGSSTWKTLDNLAQSTGGEHFHASTGAQLVDIYTQIAGKLQETAGGDTEIALDFQKVKINDGDADLRQYMDYEYQSSVPIRIDDSTYINKTNVTRNGEYNQLYYLTQNDDAAWEARTMSFDVGTIKLNETWTATFRVNLTKAGKIDLFGPNSSLITFTDASTGNTQTGFIPAMQCQVKDSIVNLGFGTKTLKVDNLSRVTTAVPDPNVWTIKWNTTYNGEKTVEEGIMYRRHNAGEQWKTLPGGLLSFSTHPLYEYTYEYSISASDDSVWLPGKTYEFLIAGGAEDSNAARSNTITIKKPESGENIYIKLE